MSRNKRKVISGICLLVLLASAGYLGVYYRGQHKQAQAYQRIAADAKTKDTKPESLVDFEKLQGLNPDIYAWITIPDTVVDYPVLQSGSENQEYYLYTTAEGVYGDAGAIFTQNYNAKDFTDKNTLIYGHDMDDGSMFGALDLFLNEDYMKAHPEIFIYTPEHIFTYQVFAAVTYDDRHILQNFDFNDDAAYQAYLDSLHNAKSLNTYWNPNVQVNVGERMITLSTCNLYADQRFLLGAVLVNEK